MKSKENLVWLDLEMSGLDPVSNVILEIALIITDKNMNVLHDGFEMVIHQSDTVLDDMDEWCTSHHRQSGLTDAVKQSTISTAQTEQAALEVVKEFCVERTAMLAGNSIWQDRLFLQKYMPQLLGFLHYKMIDVTTVQQLLKRWHPSNAHLDFKKENKHRAMPDIQESLAELKHYKKYFFDTM